MIKKPYSRRVILILKNDGFLFFFTYTLNRMQLIFAAA
ncbi:hypothetical protein [Klebsiella pneumoniae IS53]|nr:hypothetical protein [Klebsiella pneumoniae IS53]